MAGLHRLPNDFKLDRSGQATASRAPKSFVDKFARTRYLCRTPEPCFLDGLTGWELSWIVVSKLIQNRGKFGRRRIKTSMDARAESLHTGPEEGIRISGNDDNEKLASTEKKVGGR